jgi:CubicO group peptidase (beta-lactamase class C family)
MKNKLNLILLLAFVALFGQSSDQLASRFYQISDQYDAIGASYCLVTGDQIYNYSYGWKDYDRQLRIDNDTKFRIASISKVITALAAMKLVEDNQVDLDSDVSSYLGFTLRNPNFPDNQITLRHLLTHTSGLRDSNAYTNFISQSYSQNPPAISQLLMTSGSFYNSSIWTSYYEPGQASGWDYSNLSAGLVATLVENVAQEHFSTYVQDNFLNPLGIEACWNNFSALSDINDLAVLYRYVGGQPSPQADNYQGVYPEEIDLNQIPFGWNGLIYAPQGGLRISTSDLAKIFMMMRDRGSYNGQVILEEATINQMEDLNWTGSGLGGFFTQMGLQLQRTYDLFPNELFFGHAGEAYGLISDAYYNLERDIILVFLTNGGNYSYGNLFYDYEESIFSATKEWLDAVSNNNQVIANEDVNIYPNIINSLDQKISVSTKDKLSYMALYNLKGQLIKRFTNPEKEISLKQTRLGSGFYILKIASGNKIFTRKLIIKK